MKDTVPVFVLSAGRSGSKQVAKLFAGVPHVEAHHEYCRDAYQRAAGIHAMLGGKSDIDLIRMSLNLFDSAIGISDAQYFVDSSNKLAWVADVLATQFPTAKFVHLVRDGRKVASSFFHKLPEVYSERGVRVLQQWLDNEGPLPPPPEEFWWPIPQRGQPFHEEFKSWTRFQRCCYQWEHANRRILEALEKVPEERKLTATKLENLVESEHCLGRFLQFFDVPYDDSFMQALAKPTHVYVPVDYPLSAEQTAQFKAICGGMMERLGYDCESEEYRVAY